jgi:zinc transporter 2
MLDTAHLATDVLGFAIAIMAIKLAERKASKSMSFGYHRAEILGTLLSLAFLWGITIFLLFAAYKRLLAPPEIQENIMLITAVGGLIFNIIQMTILGGHDHDHGHDHSHGHGHSHSHASQEPLLEDDKKQQKRNINLDGAMLHVLGDLLNSVGVIIAAVIIWFWP